MKRNIFKVSVFLVGMALAGSSMMLTSCSDDELTEVAPVRPEGEAGTNPTINNNGLSQIPTITKVVADEPNKKMTIEGTNLLSIVRVTHTFVAEQDGKTNAGVAYKVGDEVVEDITATIDKENSTNEALVLALAEGKITAYYDSYDISKFLEDGGFNVPVPVINKDGFKTDWESKTMTIEGENLDRVAHILVGDKDPVDLIDNDKTEITATKITLPLWDGKIALNYDINNPNRIVHVDGYKFTIPTIASVDASSEDNTKIIIKGTNFDFVTGITIDEADVTIPTDLTKEAITIDAMEGKVKLMYSFNDEVRSVSYLYIAGLPQLPLNHLDIVHNIEVGANDQLGVNKEDGSLTITPSGNYTGTIVLNIPEEALNRSVAVTLALESSVSGGQIVYVYNDGSKEEKYNWNSDQSVYDDTKLTLPKDKKLTKIIINNQNADNVFTLKYVEFEKVALPAGQIDISDKVKVGPNDKIEATPDGGVIITPAGNYTGTIILTLPDKALDGAKNLILALEASIKGGQIVYQFIDQDEKVWECLKYNWNADDAANYGDTQLNIESDKVKSGEIEESIGDKTLKQIIINNQEPGNVFTLKYVEIKK